MTDPRENKLPAWARDQMEALRVRAALAWPSEPKPEPWFDVNGGAGQFPPPDATNTVAWWVHTSSIYDSRPRAERVSIDRHGYGRRNPDSESFGSRLTGPHYRTERDALLAGQWMIAERAAKALREAAKMIEAIDAEAAP